MDPKRASKVLSRGSKGKTKEAVGAVTGNDEMQREGEAQQKKADAQRDVAGKEAEAEKARATAEATGTGSKGTNGHATRAARASASEPFGGSTSSCRIATMTISHPGHARIIQEFPLRSAAPRA